MLTDPHMIYLFVAFASFAAPASPFLEAKITFPAYCNRPAAQGSLLTGGWKGAGTISVFRQTLEWTLSTHTSSSPWSIFPSSCARNENYVALATGQKRIL